MHFLGKSQRSKVTNLHAVHRVWRIFIDKENEKEDHSVLRWEDSIVSRFLKFIAQKRLFCYLLLKHYEDLCLELFEFQKGEDKKDRAALSLYPAHGTYVTI